MLSIFVSERPRYVRTRPSNERYRCSRQYYDELRLVLIGQQAQMTGKQTQNWQKKTYYTNVSDVPRSLQSWVSTIHMVVLTADVFQLFIKYTEAQTVRCSKLAVKSRRFFYCTYVATERPKTVPAHQMKDILRSRYSGRSYTEVRLMLTGQSSTNGRELRT